MLINLTIHSDCL